MHVSSICVHHEASTGVCTNLQLDRPWRVYMSRTCAHRAVAHVGVWLGHLVALDAAIPVGLFGISSAFMNYSPLPIVHLPPPSPYSSQFSSHEHRISTREVCVVVTVVLGEVNAPPTPLYQTMRSDPTRQFSHVLFCSSALSYQTCSVIPYQTGQSDPARPVQSDPTRLVQSGPTRQFSHTLPEQFSQTLIPRKEG